MCVGEKKKNTLDSRSNCGIKPKHPKTIDLKNNNKFSKDEQNKKTHREREKNERKECAKIVTYLLPNRLKHCQDKTLYIRDRVYLFRRYTNGAK